MGLWNVKKLFVHTQVKASVATVAARMDGDLFLALQPKFPPARILRYDGEKPGDWVMLEINLLGIRQQWHSEITTRYEGEQIFWFVDEGRKLPFFLTHWVHIHRVVGLPDGTSELQEDVRYDTPWWVPGFAVRLALLQMFTARRPIYRRWFERA